MIHCVTTGAEMTCNATVLGALWLSAGLFLLLIIAVAGDGGEGAWLSP